MTEGGEGAFSSQRPSFGQLSAFFCGIYGIEEARRGGVSPQDFSC